MMQILWIQKDFNLHWTSVATKSPGNPVKCHLQNVHVASDKYLLK